MCILLREYFLSACRDEKEHSPLLLLVVRLRTRRHMHRSPSTKPAFRCPVAPLCTRMHAVKYRHSDTYLWIDHLTNKLHRFKQHVSWCLFCIHHAAVLISEYSTAVSTSTWHIARGTWDVVCLTGGMLPRVFCLVSPNCCTRMRIMLDWQTSSCCLQGSRAP